MKAVFLALVYAAVVEWRIFRFESSGYSATIETGLTAVAFVGSIPVGILAKRQLMAFCGGLALGAPAISYSMLGYGLLETGGIVHVLPFGFLGVMTHQLARRFRRIKLER
jgi:hypothetical protein